MRTLSDKEWQGLEAKVRTRERLSFDEGIRLLQCDQLLRLGRLADMARRLRVGDDVYFINNRHINHTNVCKNRCLFCAFSRDPGEEGAFTLSLEEVLQKARESLGKGITELHIVGGENTGLPYSEVREMIARLHELAPAVSLTAFTASEVVHFAEQASMSEEEVLADLKEAGLATLPGGGAEILASRVRLEVCPKKISGEKWLDVHKKAHRLGLKTNATMLYGHREKLEERVDHLVRLREAQDETGGFQAFIPLAFHPQNTKLSDTPASTGADDLKVIAVSRLLLDNFRHIKAYWIMLGLKLAQVSLYFGANDLDGTIVEERITHMAGAAAGQAVTRSQLERLIRDVGRMPVERDSFYNPVRRNEGRRRSEVCS